MLLELGKLITQLGFSILGGIVAANPLAKIVSVLAEEFGVANETNTCTQDALCNAIKISPDAVQKLKKISDENMGLFAGQMATTVHNLMTHITESAK